MHWASHVMELMIMAEGHNLSFIQWFPSWAEPQNLLEGLFKNIAGFPLPHSQNQCSKNLNF